MKQRFRVVLSTRNRRISNIDLGTQGNQTATVAAMRMKPGIRRWSNARAHNMAQLLCHIGNDTYIDIFGCKLTTLDSSNHRSVGMIKEFIR